MKYGFWINIFMINFIIRTKQILDDEIIFHTNYIIASVFLFPLVKSYRLIKFGTAKSRI